MNDPLPEATLSGPFGKAWKGVLTPDTHKQWPAGLDLYLMEHPSAHPFWRWYVVSAITLRDYEGVPPANIVVPGATHEFTVVALHPDYKPDSTWCSDSDGRWAAQMLSPANLCEQLTDLDDEQANELVYIFTRSFVMGHLSPDSDYRTVMARALRGTADHLRQGLHRVQ